MLRHRLALNLGCTVAELGQRMLYTELRDWYEYARREPFGSPADDQRFALLIASVFQAQGAKVSVKEIWESCFNRDRAAIPKEAGSTQVSAMEERMDRAFDAYNAKL